MDEATVMQKLEEIHQAVAKAATAAGGEAQAVKAEAKAHPIIAAALTGLATGGLIGLSLAPHVPFLCR